MNFFLKTTTLCCWMFSTFVFAENQQSSEPDIYHQWKLEQVVYADQQVKKFSAGSYLQIENNLIVENIKGAEERQFPFIRQQQNLNLSSGDEIIIWEIVASEKNLLKIQTPIGLYVLTR